MQTNTNYSKTFRPMEQTLWGGGAAGDMAEGLGRPLPSPVTKMEMASTTADHLGEQQQHEDLMSGSSPEGDVRDVD